MKRALIGGFLSLIGVAGILNVQLLCSENLTTGWSTPPGRFLTTVAELQMTPMLVFSCIFLALGVLIMGIEYFRKD